MTQEDLDTLARTLYGEARGESMQGKIAVAHVVMNRYSRPGWWTREMGDGIPDDTVQAACRDPWQFSCWNSDDPNLPKLLAVTADDKLFRHCLYAAVTAMEGLIPDPTSGSTHYHTKSVMPSWAAGKRPVCSIGVHQFYNDIA